MENILVLHRRAVTAVRPVVGRVTTTDLTLPTPCADWDLNALLEHMTGQDHGFAAAVRATHSGSDADIEAFAPRPLGPSPAATHAAGLDAVVAAFAEADGHQGPVLLPEFDARLPLTTIVGMHLIDTLLHGWDVAAALGIQAGYGERFDDDILAAASTISEQVPDGPAREAPGAPFGLALAAASEDDTWTRILAHLGRDPFWTAPAAATTGAGGE
jgi:uncharacterized protein (TIGR03086 family)